MIKITIKVYFFFALKVRLSNLILQQVFYILARLSQYLLGNTHSRAREFRIKMNFPKTTFFRGFQSIYITTLFYSIDLSMQKIFFGLLYSVGKKVVTKITFETSDFRNVLKYQSQHFFQVCRVYIFFIVGAFLRGLLIGSMSLGEI